VIADVPRMKLSELVGRFGPGLSGNARRCKALLADVCGNQYRAECAVLITAVEEGVAGDLLSTSSGLPVEVLLGRLSDRLQANRGVSADLARWGVESWAVALGVAAGGDTLAKFRMDGLVPLIDLAGAEGRISEAQLNHLIAEAKTRGVSEADARAYLAAYAVARGWQHGGPQRRGPNAPAQPFPSPKPPPQPQPTYPPRNQSLRWAAAGFAALAAIAVIVAIVQTNQPQPPTPVAPTPTTRTPRPMPPADTPQQQRQTDADREQRAYNAAHGDLRALKAYVDSCVACAYAPDARQEISKLETAEEEERTYNAARGNKYLLQAYIDTCALCTYKSAALAEIATLENAQPKRISSSTVICGHPISYVIDATGATEPYRSFLGVWTGAAWNSRICGGLIVQSVDNNGSASITYVYGPLPGVQFPWKRQSPNALIRYGQLTFQDEENGNFTFRLAEQNVLHGHFVSVRGVTLDAVLTREMSSVPQ
jgi:hypothetical protein